MVAGPHYAGHALLALAVFLESGQPVANIKNRPQIFLYLAEDNFDLGFYVNSLLVSPLQLR